MTRQNAPKTAQQAKGRHSTTLSQRHLPGSSSSASAYKHLMPCCTLAAIRSAEKRGVRYVPYLTLIANRPAKQRRHRLDTWDQQQGPAASPHLLPHTNNNNSHSHNVTNNSPAHAPPALSPHTQQQHIPEALSSQHRLHEQTQLPAAGTTPQQLEPDDDTSQVFVAEYVRDLITQVLAHALCGQEGGGGHQQASHLPPSVTVIMAGAAREAPPPPHPPQPRTIQPLAQRLLKAGAGWYRGVSANTTTNNNNNTKMGWINMSRSGSGHAAPGSSGGGSAPGSTSTTKPRSASSRRQSLTWGRQPASPPCAAVSRQISRFSPPSAPAVPSSPPTVIIALEAQSNQHPVHEPAAHEHTRGHCHTATPTRDRAASQDSGEGWGSSEDGGHSDTSHAGGRAVFPVAASSPNEQQQGFHSLSQSRKTLDFFMGSEVSTPCTPSPLLDSPQPSVSPTIGAGGGGGGGGGGAHRRRQPHPSPTSLTLTQPPCRVYSPSTPTPDTDRDIDTGARGGDQSRRKGLLKPDLLGLAGKRVAAVLRQRKGKGGAVPLPRARTFDVVGGQGCGGSESGSLAMAATTPDNGRRGWGAGQEALMRKVGLRVVGNGGDQGEEGVARCGCVGRCSIM